MSSLRARIPVALRMGEDASINASRKEIMMKLVLYTGLCAAFSLGVLAAPRLAHASGCSPAQWQAYETTDYPGISNLSAPTLGDVLIPYSFTGNGSNDWVDNRATSGGFPADCFSYWDNSTGNWLEDSLYSCFNLSSNVTEILAYASSPSTRPWFLDSGTISYWNGRGYSAVSGSNKGSITNFTVDTSDVIYAIGGNGTCNSSNVPDGPCIYKTSNDGTSWSQLSGEPGAEQITSDLVSSTPTLWAIGSAQGIWSKPFSSTTWTKESHSTICGGSTQLNPVMIAASDGFVWAISGNTGNYVYVLGSSDTCWTELTGLSNVESIAAGTQTGGIVAVSSGDLYLWCN
jgi:hypothetical protein